MLVTPKKNILHYTGSATYQGGSAVSSISRRAAANPGEFCIDSGFNWTEICYQYGGVLVEACTVWGSNWASPFIVGSACRVDDLMFLYKTEGTLSTAKHVFDTWTVGYDTISLGFGNYVTASFGLVMEPPLSTYKYFNIQSSDGTNETVQGSLDLRTVPLNPGRNCNICIYRDWGAFEHTPSGSYLSMDSRGYCYLKISGWDKVNTTLLFHGVAWQDSGGRKGLKDLVSNKMFYNIGPGEITT